MRLTYAPRDCLPADPLRYDSRAAHALGELAVGVYLTPWNFSHASIVAGWTGANVFEERGVQVGVAYHPNVIAIVPRGSSERGDWRDNFFSVWRRGWSPPLPPDASLGWGFRRQLAVSVERVLSYIDPLMETFSKAKILVTGHSLGAALAAGYVAALTQRPGRNPYCAYLFESPRAGNAAWATWYESLLVPTWSVVCASRGRVDLITRVPKKRWGFRHVGNRVILADKGTYHGLDAWEEYRASSPVGHLAGWRIVSRLFHSIRAHTGANLLAALASRVEIIEQLERVQDEAHGGPVLVAGGQANPGR